MGVSGGSCVAFGYFFGRRHIILRQICPEVDRKWTGSGQLLPQSGQLLDNFWTTFGQLFNVNCEITNVKSENLVFHVKCEIILGQKLSTFCPFWSKSCPLAVQSCPFRGKSCPPKSANPLNYIKSVKKRPFSH